MAPRGFVSTDQAHFGRGGGLSQGRAEMRHKRTQFKSAASIKKSPPQKNNKKKKRQRQPGSAASVSDRGPHCETFLAFTRHKNGGGTALAVIKMFAKLAKRICFFFSSDRYSWQRRQWRNQGGDRYKQGGTQQVVTFKKGRLKQKHKLNLYCEMCKCLRVNRTGSENAVAGFSVIYPAPQPTGDRIDGGLLRLLLIQSIVYSGIICCFHCWLISAISRPLKAGM